MVQPRPEGSLGYRSTIATEPLGLELVGSALKGHTVYLWDMLNSNVFVGGHHATLNYKDFFHSCIDAVVLGEGETTTPEVIILTPLPGTRLYNEFKEYLINTKYELFDLQHTVLPTKLPLKDFYKEFANLYKNAYNSHKGIFSSFKGFLKETLYLRISYYHLHNLLSGVRATSDPLCYLCDHEQKK